jgi:soluble lytic murein transglycosylase-like protein
VQAASTPLRRDLLRVASAGLVLVAAVAVLASHAHADGRLAAQAMARTAAQSPAAGAQRQGAWTIASRCPVPARLRRPFELAARSADLPVSLVAAVARVESRFHPRARSPVGAVGLLQVLPATALSVGSRVDGVTGNVLAGARYLRSLVDRFPSIQLALAAYNAGPTAVEEFGGAPTGETLTYVANVMSIVQATWGCT